MKEREGMGRFAIRRRGDVWRMQTSAARRRGYGLDKEVVLLKCRCRARRRNHENGERDGTYVRGQDAGPVPEICERQHRRRDALRMFLGGGAGVMLAAATTTAATAIALVPTRADARSAADSEANNLLVKEPMFSDGGYSRLPKRIAKNRVEDAVLAAKQRRAEEEERSIRELEANPTLCATPFGVDVVGITELILVVGAITGGISARVRKRELEELNSKLRLINVQLREQARSGVIYAPGLTYAPPLQQPQTMRDDTQTSVTVEDGSSAAATGNGNGGGGDRVNGNGATMSSRSAPSAVMADESPSSGPSCDVRDAARAALKKGKNLIAMKDAATAMVYFNKGAMLARQRGDMVLLRRARRGLAAAKRMKGDTQGAIRHLERVLEMSKEMNDFTGDTDALGTLADLYSEAGDLDTAGKYYDMFIANLAESDDAEDASAKKKKNDANDLD